MGPPHVFGALLAPEAHEVRWLRRPTLIHLTLLRLGRALFALGRHTEARDAFAEAGDALDGHDVPSALATAFIWHARALAALGETDAARASATRARHIQAERDLPATEADEALAEIEALRARRRS